MKTFRLLTVCMLLLASSAVARAEVYILSKSDISGISERVVERLYTGKQIEFNNRTLVPINYVSDHPLRNRFLSVVIGKTETEFAAYWATRRYVGLGVPPEEVRDRSRMLNALGSRDNAIGYIEATADEAAELRRRFNLLLLRQTPDTRN